MRKVFGMITIKGAKGAITDKEGAGIPKLVIELFVADMGDG